MSLGTADAVVVGAGILGAATAYELAGAGLRVVVLDRGPANREASGATAGNLHMQAVHTRRPGQEVPLDNVRFLALQQAAAPLWADLPDQLEADLELRRDGGFMVALTAEQEDDLRAKHAHERAAGLPTEVLDGDEARRRLPLLGRAVRAATWCPWDGYANPLKVTPAWLAAGRRAGVQLRTMTPVTGLDRTATGWVVRTPAGTLSTPWVIDVAGPRLAEVAALAGARLAVAPLAIQMHATVRVPPMLGHLVQHIGEGLSVKQVHSGQVLVGGGWPARSTVLDGRSPASARSLVGNLAAARTILPFLGELTLLRAWTGTMSTTPDEMPVVGPVPGHPGMLVAGGTYAFTFAPLWARVLTDLVLGRPPRLPVADLAPDRLGAGALRG